MATTTSYVTPGPLGYDTPPVPTGGVAQTYTTNNTTPITTNNKGSDDTAELRRRVQYLEERMTRTEPSGAVSSKSLAEAVGTTPSSHASVVANPAPLGLFAFGLTTAMLSVRSCSLLKLRFRLLLVLPDSPALGTADKSSLCR